MSGFGEADGYVNQMNNSMLFFPAYVSAVLAKITVLQAPCLLLRHNILEKTNQLLLFPLTD